MPTCGQSRAGAGFEGATPTTGPGSRSRLSATQPARGAQTTASQLAGSPIGRGPWLASRRARSTGRRRDGGGHVRIVRVPGGRAARVPHRLLGEPQLLPRGDLQRLIQGAVACKGRHRQFEQASLAGNQRRLASNSSCVGSMPPKGPVPPRLHAPRLRSRPASNHQPPGMQGWLGGPEGTHRLGS